MYHPPVQRFLISNLQSLIPASCPRIFPLRGPYLTEKSGKRQGIGKADSLPLDTLRGRDRIEEDEKVSPGSTGEGRPGSTGTLQGSGIL